MTISTLLPSPISFLEHPCPKCTEEAPFQAVSCPKCNAALSKVSLSFALGKELDALFQGLSQGSLVVDEGHLLKHTFGKCPQWGDWLRWKTQVVLLSRAAEGWVPTLISQLRNILASFPYLDRDIGKYLRTLDERKREIDSRLRRLLGAPIHNPLEKAFVAYHLAFSAATNKMIEKKVAGRDSSALESNGALEHALTEVDRVNNALEGHSDLVDARVAFDDHIREVVGLNMKLPADLVRASLEWDALEQAFSTAVGAYPRESIKSLANLPKNGGLK